MSGCDVIVCGGGPVGVGLAIDLGQRGLSCLVIERHTRLQNIPKGQNMTQRTGEHFRRWGVSRQIRAASPIPDSFGNSGAVVYGTLLGEYAHDWLNRSNVRAFYGADNERLPQYDTERVLRERAAQVPGVDIRLGWTVTGLTQAADRVEVEIRQTASDATERLSAPWVVGCDGAGSQVRGFAGITQTEDDRGKRMALIVFRSPEFDRLLGPERGAKAFLNVMNPALEGYWQFFGRVDAEGTWFFHAPVPDSAGEDQAAFDALLERVVGQPFAKEFHYIGFWNLRFALADRYRAGRVFIAGDAAHVHPPYGGFGINTGFDDARNLAWKLAAEVQGWGSGALLDSYGAERHSVFADTRDHFIARMIEDDRAFTAAHDPARDRAEFEAAWNARAAGGDPEVSRFLPNYAGSPVVWGGEGRSGAVGEHRHRARAGHHLSPVALADGESVFDRLSDGFTLISLGGNPAAVADFTAAAAAQGVPMTIIETPLCDSTARWQARLILIRPDHFVAFAGDTPIAPAAAILARATGRAPDTAPETP